MENIVKQLREKRGISQEKFAQEIGVSRFTVIKIESGGNTTPTTVFKIAEFFGKDPREIFFTNNGAHSLQKAK